MDDSLLRSWLGLPPGPWPPDHYALLGLSPGNCDAAAIEALVLARMDLLRTHQLLHPDLVTEGMNRLAQALICLTDPKARAAYDAGLEGQKQSPAVGDPELLLDRPPESLPYEVVEPLEPLPPAYEVVWEDEPQPSVKIVEAPLVTPSVRQWQPGTRRELFARLAALRRLIAAWQKLRPFLGDPREPLTRPVRVLLFVEAIANVRPLLEPLDSLAAMPAEPGRLVGLILAQPHFLHVFRLMLPDQRRAIAIDWRRGEEGLAREYKRLRELVRSGRPRHRSRRRCRAFWWIVRTPELVLLGLALAALAAAFLRFRGWL